MTVDLHTAPADAYQVLQVDPRASQELIQAVYWRLVAIAATDSEHASAKVAPRSDLNRAYQLLAHADDRSRYDLEYGHDRRRTPVRVIESRRGLLRRTRRLVVGASHYRILHVHPRALPAIVDVAYRVRRSELAGVDATIVAQRQALELAYATLSDPVRRSAYARARDSLTTALDPSSVEIENAQRGADVASDAWRLVDTDVSEQTQPEVELGVLPKDAGDPRPPETRPAVRRPLQLIANALSRRRGLERMLSERLAGLTPTDNDATTSDVSPSMAKPHVSEVGSEPPSARRSGVDDEHQQLPGTRS